MVLVALIIVVLLINGVFRKDSVIDYNPIINPDDFTNKVDNLYFNMPVGRMLTYESKTEDEIERIEILVPGWTRNIMGVETLVFWDRVYFNGQLIEDTRDYIAQDSEGNVWYFGENVDNYENGTLVNHAGAWIGGIDGALPGIWMLSNPEVDEEYRQEFYEGEAEDMARVDSLGIGVSVPAGDFINCIKIFEFTPLNDATAFKYHCPEIGGVVLEEEGNERVELIEINDTGALSIEIPRAYADEGVVA